VRQPTPGPLCYNRSMNRAPGTNRPGKQTQLPVILNLTLPLPPGINNQYATVNGHRVLTSEARQFKNKAKHFIADLCLSGRISDDMLGALRASYLSLFIDFYFASPMKRDLDGGLKITQDAICESLDINDNRVVDIHLVKRIDPLRPRVNVQLETIPEDEWHFDEEFIYRDAADAGSGSSNGMAQESSA
jgi:crossover junction endodeoxyribonuclease RusA